MRLALCLAASALLSLVIAPAPASATYETCALYAGASGSGSYDLRAENMPCDAAREVARKWDGRCLGGRCCRVTSRGRAYRCTTNSSHTAGSCVSGIRRIRFRIGYDD